MKIQSALPGNTTTSTYAAATIVNRAASAVASNPSSVADQDLRVEVSRHNDTGNLSVFVHNGSLDGPSQLRRPVHETLAKTALASGVSALGAIGGGAIAAGMGLLGQQHPQVGLLLGTMGVMSDNEKHPSQGYAFLAMASASLDALVPDPTISSIASSVSAGAVLLATCSAAVEGAEIGWNIIS